MNQPIDIDRTSTDEDDLDHLPCPGALLAGTLALMTAWADPCGNAQCIAAKQRHLMARKIVSNLFFLKEHPHVAPLMRNVMANAHRRWVLVAASVEEGEPAPSAPSIESTDEAAPVPRRATLH